MNNLLSVKQVAFILRVHPLTIRRYIKDKRLKAIKVGGNVRIEEEILQNFHKEITSEEQTTRIYKKTNVADKQFTHDDPILRLQAAELVWS